MLFSLQIIADIPFKQKMIDMIGIGDIIKFQVNTVDYTSKVFNISICGKFAFVDYFEGQEVRHRREKKIPLDEVSLLSKKSSPIFSNEQIKFLLRQSYI